MLPVQGLTSFFSQNQLFDANKPVLAAVSGGMDSVLMVHLLRAAGYAFAIAHCNFCLRGDEADADQQFCSQLAHQLNVPFHTINFDTPGYAAQHKISIQMAARQLRYQWFEQLRHQHSYHAIALAHHQNDTIETILLNLTRGTGIAGLHGILPKNGYLVRPMLFLQRSEIEQIIREENIAYREDSSNTSDKYARNKIRLDVIPKLKELNPNLEETFNRNLAHFRDLEQLLEMELEKLRQEIIHHDDEQHLPLMVIKNLRPQRLLLFNLLKPYGFNEATVDDVTASLDKHAGRTFESPDYLLTLDRISLIIIKKTGEQLLPVQIEYGTNAVDYHRYHITLLHDDSPLIIKDNPMAASVDATLLQYPLTVRTWEQGDYFYPLGMKDRQKLSDFFIHQKIPLHQKSSIPLLVNGTGEIIWVAGYRLNDRYKVTRNTEKVTIFEMYKNDER